MRLIKMVYYYFYDEGICVDEGEMSRAEAFMHISHNGYMLSERAPNEDGSLSL